MGNTTTGSAPTSPTTPRTSLAGDPGAADTRIHPLDDVLMQLEDDDDESSSSTSSSSSSSSHSSLDSSTTEASDVSSSSISLLKNPWTAHEIPARMDLSLQGLLENEYDGIRLYRDEMDVLQDIADCVWALRNLQPHAHHPHVSAGLSRKRTLRHLMALRRLHAEFGRLHIVHQQQQQEHEEELTEDARRPLVLIDAFSVQLNDIQVGTSHHAAALVRRKSRRRRSRVGTPPAPIFASESSLLSTQQVTAYDVLVEILQRGCAADELVVLEVLRIVNALLRCEDTRAVALEQVHRCNFLATFCYFLTCRHFSTTNAPRIKHYCTNSHQGNKQQFRAVGGVKWCVQQLDLKYTHALTEASDAQAAVMLPTILEASSSSSASKYASPAPTAASVLLQSPSCEDVLVASSGAPLHVLASSVGSNTSSSSSSLVSSSGSLLVTPTNNSAESCSASSSARTPPPEVPKWETGVAVLILGAAARNCVAIQNELVQNGGLLNLAKLIRPINTGHYRLALSSVGALRHCVEGNTQSVVALQHQGVVKWLLKWWRDTDAGEGRAFVDKAQERDRELAGIVDTLTLFLQENASHREDFVASLGIDILSSFLHGWRSVGDLYESCVSVLTLLYRLLEHSDVWAAHYWELVDEVDIELAVQDLIQSNPHPAVHNKATDVLDEVFGVSRTPPLRPGECITQPEPKPILISSSTSPTLVTSPTRRVVFADTVTECMTCGPSAKPSPLRRAGAPVSLHVDTSEPQQLAEIAISRHATILSHASASPPRMPRVRQVAHGESTAPLFAVRPPTPPQMRRPATTQPHQQHHLPSSPRSLSVSSYARSTSRPPRCPQQQQQRNARRPEDPLEFLHMALQSGDETLRSELVREFGERAAQQLLAGRARHLLQSSSATT